jgi:uncharacterized membrane protein YraQ (UPF0718 family)
MDSLLLGAVVRMTQALISALPTIVVGWLIAAVFERFLGREGTFKLFGGRSWRQLPNAWLLGMLLPVCSLGVIPVMVQMRRSGIAAGTILAFGLTAPLFNPISVLYGLTLSDPFALFVFCMASLAIVTIMGLLWDYLYPNDWIEPEVAPQAPVGLKRIGAVGLSMCQQAFSSSTLYILLAVVGVGILSIVLPAGVLQRSANRDDWTAPLTMAGVSTLAYVTPMVAIVQVASMFQHGNSIGAAFTLLVLGTGVNLGVLVWIAMHYQWRRACIWFLGLIVVVLAISYGVDGPLLPQGVEPADHTHAFDSYCNPFSRGATDLFGSTSRLIRDAIKPEEIVAGVFALIVLLIGAIQHRFDRARRWSQWLSRQPQPKAGSARSYDIVLPNSVIAAVSLIGLVVASIGGCFLYYPPLGQIRKELTDAQAELSSAAAGRKWNDVEFWLPIQEDWLHKLQVSCYLRGTPLTRFQKARLKVLLTKLELLEHAAEDRELAEVDKWNREVNIALNRFKGLLPRPSE